MKTNIQILLASFLCMTLAAVVIGVPMAQSQSPTPTPTSSSESLEEEPLVDIETIKEQVKQRIQDVVQIDNVKDIANKPHALLGTLTSIANNTLTIESDTGTQLASTSAQTKIQQLPKLSSLDMDELSIDKYVVIMGVTGTSEVLDARYVLVHDSPPSIGKIKAFYGVIVAHDLDADTVLLQNPTTNIQETFDIGRKTAIRLQVTTTREEEGDRTEQFPLTQPALILYEPVTDEDENPLALDILINQLVETSTDILGTPAATESALPPELER